MPGLIAEQGWVLLDDAIYADEAKSGTTSVGRSGFIALKAAAEQHPRPFDAVIFDDTSRCARGEAEIKVLVKLFRHHGISVHFVQQNLHSTDDNFDIMLTMCAIFDAQFVTRLRKKVSRARKDGVSLGFMLEALLTAT